MTDHQLAAFSFLLACLSVVVPVLIWLSRKLDLIGKRQMQRSLDQIKNLGVLGYAEEMQRKMRRCLCLAAYLVCCVITVFALPWPHMGPLEVTLAGAAAIMAAIANGYNEVSTADRVRKRRKEFRADLGLEPEVEEQPPQPIGF